VAVPVYVADFYGRRIDILGRVQGVSPNTAQFGQITAICRIGGPIQPSSAQGGAAYPGVQFPSGGRGMVLFLTIENYGASIPANTSFKFGSLPLCTDFSGGSQDMSGLNGFYAPGPIIFGNSIHSFVVAPIVYAAGTTFGALNQSGSSSSTTLWTLTAYGFAY